MPLSSRLVEDVEANPGHAVYARRLTSAFALKGRHGLDGRLRGDRGPANRIEEAGSERNAYTDGLWVAVGLHRAGASGGLPDEHPRSESDARFECQVREGVGRSVESWCERGGSC